MAYRVRTLLATVALIGLASPALAQGAGDARRLDRIEQSVRALQAAVGQAQSSGQPVVVRPEGPDPAVTDMQQRVADLEQTLQRINGQLETLAIEVDQAKRADTAAEADRRGAMQGLNDRITRLESQLATVLGPTDAGAAGGTLNSQIGAATPPPPPPPAPPANAAEAFAAARAVYTGGDMEAAGRAFEDFVARYGSNTRAPEAYYWLGESYFARKGYQTATAAYANALKARPTTAWAPGAMARLAQSLAYSNQAPQACAALAEFDSRYAAKATAAVKANAQVARTRARCT